MRQPRDQVDVDIRNAGGAQVCDIFKHRRPIVQTPDRGRLLINERLHAQAHAVHAAAPQSFDYAGSQRAAEHIQP